MIQAVIFDLDGTLVQTEKLKARSYALAAVELGQGSFSEQDVIQAFKEVVGLSRQEVAQYLLKRFELEDAARDRMEVYHAMTPWQAYVQIRMKTYESMLDDPLAIVRHRCPYNLDLLIWAREYKYKTGLATMSHCPQVSRILQILDISNEFDFIATGDDVNTGKPDPEIYQLMAHELGIKPAAGLVIEDSLTGVKAAVAAGMGCVAMTSKFTDKSVRSSGLLDKRWIVDNPAELKAKVKAFIKQAA
jgi:beta-phosphoglucomutase-like phosphatase (HAD superfamily)